MRLLSSVVWSEGMYLAPHHFQAQNRCFEDSLRTRVEMLCFRPHGLAGYTLDMEAVRNGLVVLVHARGIMPDGLCFNAPDSDPAPEPLRIDEAFPVSTDRVVVHLSIPRRYVPEERTVADENSSVSERPVVFGRRNLALDTGETLPAERCSLPIARVLRDGAGGFRYDSEFVPPLLDIAADEGLMMRVRRLIEVLDEKSASLAPRDAGAAADFSTREAAAFWLLHAINSGVAALRHLWTSKRGHPEELFLAMSRLGGALCTFAPDSHPRSLPAYDHDDLASCFAALDRHIREHLEAALPVSAIPIPLRRIAPYIYEGEVADARAMGRADWVLGIRAKVGQSALITSPPQLVKFCSSRFVAELVKRALPGLTLRHLPTPPRAIARKVEMQYFGVSKVGPAWEDIVKTKRVGVYVPGELPDAELDLLVVPGGEGQQ